MLSEAYMIEVCHHGAGPVSHQRRTTRTGVARGKETRLASGKAPENSRSAVLSKRWEGH